MLFVKKNGNDYTCLKAVTHNDSNCTACGSGKQPGNICYMPTSTTFEQLTPHNKALTIIGGNVTGLKYWFKRTDGLYVADLTSNDVSEYGSDPIPGVDQNSGGPGA